MSAAVRGILYVVWGEKIQQILDRSIRSLRAFHPDLPHHVARLDPGEAPALQQKARMAQLSPFESTLYLDADTVVTDKLNLGFEKAEQFGLACCINECPWLARYGNGNGDLIEYNTGVLFFNKKSAAVFEAWEALAPVTPARSKWSTVDNQSRGASFDDQASFSRAVHDVGFNPFVLPLNYNLRPGFERSFFTPIKIWHDYADLPMPVQNINDATVRQERPITYIQFEPAAL